MKPASQRFFIQNCIYLRILIIFYLATFLGTNSLSVLMCRKAVNQSINRSIVKWFFILYFGVSLFGQLHASLAELHCRAYLYVRLLQWFRPKPVTQCLIFVSAHSADRNRPPKLPDSFNKTLVCRFCYGLQESKLIFYDTSDFYRLIIQQSALC